MIFKHCSTALREEIGWSSLKKKQKVNKKSNDQTMDKIKGGKSNFKSMFGGVASKEQFKEVEHKNIADINDNEVEICSRIVNIIENHIAKDVIPRFNRDKAKLYYKMLQYFSVNEMHNWQLIIGFWRAIMKNKNVMSAS